MNFFQLFKGNFPTGNNRLICHNNSKIAGFIDFTNCFSNTINIQHLHCITNCRMLNIFNAGHSFCLGIR